MNNKELVEQTEEGLNMFLWCCWYDTVEWCCFVVAPTRGKAKGLFQNYWNEGDYTDVRCRKVKEAANARQGVYDMDCEELEKLDVRYSEEIESTT